MKGKVTVAQLLYWLESDHGQMIDWLNQYTQAEQVIILNQVTAARQHSDQLKQFPFVNPADVYTFLMTTVGI